MKKVKTLFLSGICLTLAACSSSEWEASSPVQKIPVRFRIALQPDILPFGTRSMPAGVPGEPTAQSGDSPSPGSPAYSFLEYAVFDSEGALVEHQQIRHSGNGGQEITIELPVGVYSVGFLAHSSASAAWEGAAVVFPESVSESFFQQEEIEVENNVDSEISTTLERIVARVEFVPKDAVPQNVARYRISTTLYHAFDMMEGKATDATLPFTLSKEFTAADREPDQRASHAFYTFVPQTKASQKSGSIPATTLQALEAGGDVWREKSVADITIFPNRITRYTGTLYTNSGNGVFDIDIDSQWGETIENDLDE